MRIKKIFTVVTFTITGLQIGFAQNANEPQPRPTPPPIAKPDLNTKISEIVTKRLEQTTDETPISRERREQAYASLLEGQRYVWNMRPPSSPAVAANNGRLAKQSFQKAVELNPYLAEGYTALAEIILRTPPNDLEEALLLAAVAVKIEPNNFGGRRILARLYTIKSRLNTGILDSGFTQKAIAEWREIARLDARNAEAHAFLGEFYARTNKPAEQIDALNRWLASAASLDSGFYSNVMGGRADLSPESALVKLGAAQLKAGRMREAVEILSRAVADNAENEEAVELLSRAIESADAPSTAIAVQALQQAVYANPGNQTLPVLLARVQAGTGKRNEALQTIRALRQRSPDDFSLVRLEAEILTGSGRVDEAVELLKTAIKKKPAASNGQGAGIVNGELIAPSPMDDEFSNLLFISNLYTQAKRGKEAMEAANSAYAISQSAERKQIAKLTLATAQQMAGDYQSAETTLRDILKQTPRNPIALNNLGYFLTERDEKLAEALKLIEQAVEIDPTNPSFLDSLGWAYFKLGKLAEAEKYLREAVQIDDSSATIHEHLGDVYQKQGKLEAAKTAWRKALSLSSEEEETNRIKAKLAKSVSK